MQWDELLCPGCLIIKTISGCGSSEMVATSGDVEGLSLVTFHIQSYEIGAGSIIAAVVVLALLCWLTICLRIRCPCPCPTGEPALAPQPHATPMTMFHRIPMASTPDYASTLSLPQPEFSSQMSLPHTNARLPIVSQSFFFTTNLVPIMFWNLGPISIWDSKQK